MSIATQAQKSTQASVIQATQRPTSNPLVVAFDRHTSMVKGLPCTQDGHPNGHITQANATQCAQARAETFLASLPDTTTQEEALEALGEVQVLTLDRFMCLTQVPEADQQLAQKCKFGHKTQAQAEACVGTQAQAKVKAASMVKVNVGGSLTQATQAKPQATQSHPEAQGKAQATQEEAKLHSGSQGSTGKA
jgi:hypothetical protein